MKLSEAIRLGSLAIQNPQSGNIRNCALAMGCEAIGQNKCGDGNYSVIADNWPWTAIFVSKAFNGWSYGSDGIWSLFDSNVCPLWHEPTMTLEALCDQVRAWEQELAAKGINVEQVSIAATPETTHEPAAEHTEKVSV